MDIRSKREMIVTVTLNEREAKLLACFMGAIKPNEAAEIICRSAYFARWLGKLDEREVVEFTGILYDSIHDLL